MHPKQAPIQAIRWRSTPTLRFQANHGAQIAIAAVPNSKKSDRAVPGRTRAGQGQCAPNLSVERPVTKNSHTKEKITKAPRTNLFRSNGRRSGSVSAKYGKPTNAT